MKPTLLLACNQVPYYGGASTTLYFLFETLQKEGWDVYYLNFIENERLKFYKETFSGDLGNPKRLSNVYNIFLSNGDRLTQLKEVIDFVGPEIMIGKNFISPYLLKTLRPDVETWFLPSSCSQIRNAIYKGIVKTETEALDKVEANGYSIPVSWDAERKAVEAADKIICHSKTTHVWFNYFFPEHKHKISEKLLWSAPLIHNKLHKQNSDLKNFANRPIDILFVANRWSRLEKNYEMVKQIIKTCKGLNIHVVGECGEEIEGAVYHGFLIHDEVIGLMKNTKTIVSTSIYDAAPNVLFEASLVGCNIITSKNCGNWALCHTDLLVEPYCLENYIEKIHLSLTKRFENNLEYFLLDDPLTQIKELIKGFKD